MTESQTAPSNPAPAAETPEEWKPEPRQWTWKDLFTAPMLAFKPKVMLSSALTVLALGGCLQLYLRVAQELQGSPKVLDLVGLLFLLLGVAIFSLGASFAAVFLRADLLDDEFLSLKEGLAQFAGRIAPAVLVPLFLLLLLFGVLIGFLYLPSLVCAIPWGVGGTIYALLYPLAYLMGLFWLLLLIAVCLSVFVFPSIVAVRKHGWFDNVVDTVEAVGTKPHLLIASLVVTLLMVSAAYLIGNGGMQVLSRLSRSSYQPNVEVYRVDNRAEIVRLQATQWYNELFDAGSAVAKEAVRGPSLDGLYGPYPMRGNALNMSDAPPADPYLHYGSGMIAGCWQILIASLIIGYCLNLFVAGGMLSYLVVREDDYWDDEDLEDLDKLAKELEEEAKREESATAPAAATTDTVPAPPAAPPSA